MGCYDVYRWVLKHGAWPLHDKVRLFCSYNPCSIHLDAEQAQALGVGLHLLCAGIMSVKHNST